MQSHQHRALHAADGRERAGLVSPGLAQIAAVTQRGAKIELRLLRRKIEPTQRHDPSVREFDDGVVNARKARAAAASVPVGFAMPGSEGPRLATIAADVQAGAGLVAIERQNHEALACTNGHVADFGFRLKHVPLGPGGAAVDRGAHDIARQSFGKKEQGALAVEPELGGVVIDVRPIPKRRSFFPLCRATTQAAGDDREFGTAFIAAGKPNRQQVAVRALGDGRAVIVIREQRAGHVRRNLHKRLWPTEEWLRHWICFGGNALAHVARIQGWRRHRQRGGLGQVCQHHAEADHVVRGGGEAAAAVGRAQQTVEDRMAAAARDSEIAIHTSHRIHRLRHFIGAIPVEAPFLDVAVHVEKPPRIGGSLLHTQR